MERQSEADDRRLRREIRSIVEGEVGGDLSGVLLFGSRARGDASPDSDWDVAVLVDDRPVWNSGVVRGRDEPRLVPRVSLKGARRLTLLVDFGPEANVLDHADWCDAVLIGAPR